MANSNWQPKNTTRFENIEIRAMDGLLDDIVESNINRDVELLHRAWRDEACAPSLLQSQGELTETLLGQMQEQQGIIDEAKSNPDEHFSAVLYQMEIDRLRYGLSRYLRTRLLKIQDDPTQDDSLLSNHEKVFSDRLRELNNQYMDGVLLSALPEDIRSLDNPTPAADDYVFIRVLEDTGDVEVGVGEYVSMLKDDVHVLLFRRALPLLSSGKISLM